MFLSMSDWGTGGSIGGAVSECALGSNELIPLHCAGIGEKFATRLTC